MLMTLSLYYYVAPMNERRWSLFVLFCSLLHTQLRPPWLTAGLPGVVVSSEVLEVDTRFFLPSFLLVIAPPPPPSSSWSLIIVQK